MPPKPDPAAKSAAPEAAPPASIAEIDMVLDDHEHRLALAEATIAAMSAANTGLTTRLDLIGDAVKIMIQTHSRGGIKATHLAAFNAALESLK